MNNNNVCYNLINRWLICVCLFLALIASPAYADEQKTFSGNDRALFHLLQEKLLASEPNVTSTAPCPKGTGYFPHCKDVPWRGGSIGMGVSTDGSNTERPTLTKFCQLLGYDTFVKGSGKYGTYSSYNNELIVKLNPSNGKWEKASTNAFWTGFTCTKKGECEDGADNDGDGLVDSSDPGCQNCTGTSCKETQGYTSTDTDGGKNKDKKGTATYTKGSGASKTATDYCADTKTLVEYYNTTTPKFGSDGKPTDGHGRTSYTCEYKCQDGACVPQCTKDSDCQSGYKCQANKCVQKSECEDGADNDGDGLVDSSDPGCQNCTGTSCKETQSYTSTDTDGGKNKDKKGTATYTKGSGASKTATDYCADTKTLVEYYNTTTPKFGSDGKPTDGKGRTSYTCDYKCQDGACVPECTKDSDCQNGYKCDNNWCVEKSECEDGADNDGDGLVDSNDPGCQNCTGTSCKETQGYTGTETDGGNVPEKKGETTYQKAGTKLPIVTDYCQDSKVLVEYYITANPKFDSKQKPVEGHGKATHTCEYSCKDGACQPQCRQDSDCESGYKCTSENKCVKKTECEDGVDNDSDGLVDANDPGCQNCAGTSCKETQGYTGTETDGGNVPEKKGETTYQKAGTKLPTVTDYCQDSKVLVEYYITANPKFDSNQKPVEGHGKATITCEYKCEDGACEPQCKVDADCQTGQICSSENKCVDDVKTVTPILECVMDNKDNTYTAYFGYENANSSVVKVPAGSNSLDAVNEITGTTSKASNQPSEFKAGREKGVVRVTFKDDETVTWTIKNTYQEAKSETASKDSTKCAPVVPQVKCININQDATLQALFGYKNDNDFEVSINIGIQNSISPSPEDRGQPVSFISGNVENAFDATFERNGSIEWTLGDVTVIADKTTKTCLANQAPSCEGMAKEVSVECQGTVTTIQLDGSACVDSDGTALIYSWSTDCQNAGLTNETTQSANLQLTNPGAGVAQTCNVTLTVTDGVATTSITQAVSVPACSKDCMGVVNGTAKEDICGVCGGDGTSCLDCAGTPFGNAQIDRCGVCNGTNKCLDCAGTPNGTAALDRCGVCNGDGMSCLQCSETDITGLKAKLHGDEFVTMLDEQTELLLDESKPYPYIRDIEASADRRLNRAEKKNAQIKKLVASLSDKMLACTNANYCAQSDNEPTLSAINRGLRKLRRQVGRTIRQRSIAENQRQSLLNSNAKILAEKLEILGKIPRFYSTCK